MKEIKLFGFFREQEHALPTGLSIRDFLSSSPYEDIEMVIQYLKAGETLATCAGFVSDVLSDAYKIAGVPSIRTDGTWVWPGDLVYYVQNYNLKLPEEMLEDMRKNGWKVPVLSDNDLMFIDQKLDDLPKEMQ